MISEAYFHRSVSTGLAIRVPTCGRAAEADGGKTGYEPIQPNAIPPVDSSRDLKSEENPALTRGAEHYVRCCCLPEMVRDRLASTGDSSYSNPSVFQGPRESVSP